MNPQLWAAFAAASLVVLAVPGPMVLMVVSVLGRGRGAGAAARLGHGAGGRHDDDLAPAGVGALLAASAPLFAARPWVGAACLAWLGVALWRAARRRGRPWPGPASASSGRLGSPRRRTPSPGASSRPSCRASSTPDGPSGRRCRSWRRPPRASPSPSSCSAGSWPRGSGGAALVSLGLWTALAARGEGAARAGARARRAGPPGRPWGGTEAALGRL